ncbi:sensor histidine kinase [Nonomuraea salmonea]|uniref:histidine kinase n=2 Tax=Nonomuraea salmonea TaxID=46181 RepID=A0ABV5NS61_9ACTN
MVHGRSIRARMTLATVASFGVLLLGGAALLSATWPSRARADLVAQAATASRHLTTIIDTQRFEDPIPPTGGIGLLQIVDYKGRVVAASAGLLGEPPITRARPTGGDSQVETRECRPEGCLAVVGTSNRATVYGPVVAYAAVREPFLLHSPYLRVMLFGSSALLLALMAWGTWYGVGRVLAPVEQIRQGLQRISAEDLSSRVAVPDSRDEVAELAATVNETLDRLEDAVERHRRFVSDASHELRTPIAGLMVRLEDGLHERGEDDWRAALADAQRLADIVQDLLLMARLDARAPVKKKRLDLGRLVEDEVARRPSRLPVTVRAEPGVHVRGNRLRLARVLTNLLSNADRYGDSKVEVHVRGSGDEAVLEVVDDGPGIPEEKREQVFERFTRLDGTRSRDLGGSGLGLPIARDIAREHGGELTIEGPQTRLVLRLPRD